MFTDEAGGTRPVGRDRRGFLKELGLGGIARERRLSCRRPPWEKRTITSSLPYILAISVFSLSGFIHVH